MALYDITICYRTTDGQIFDDPAEAEKHQEEIDQTEYIKVFKKQMQPVIEETLAPLKKYLEETYGQKISKT